MLRFGRTNVARFMSMSEIIKTLTHDRSINYSFLMPIILFLHSVSSPSEIISIISKEYRGTKDDCIKTNCFVFLICWLRESSAHFDFILTKNQLQLQEFLFGAISSESNNAQLSAAIRKIQAQLDTIVDELLDLSVCLDIYSTELNSLFAPKHDIKQKPSTVTNSPPRSSDEEPNAHDSTSPSTPPYEQENRNGHKENSSMGETPLSTALPEREVHARGSLGASDHFPALDRLGRPLHKTCTAESSSDDCEKPSPTTGHELLLEIGGKESILKKFESPLELAMHLTLVELHCGILTLRPREFTSQLWTNSSLKHTHPDIGGSRHMHGYIQYTNDCILWIAREVLIFGLEVKSLKEAISFFVQVAECAFKLNNFNTVFQVIEALKLPAIKRLTAWKSLSTHKLETFQELARFCCDSDNYTIYRQHLRGLGSQARIPCLHVLLRDITLLEKSNPWKKEVHRTVSGDEEGCDSYTVVDLRKMEAIFRLLCREVFSLRSAYITSLYISKVLCRVNLRPVRLTLLDPVAMMASVSKEGSRDRKGRGCRIDSRMDLGVVSVENDNQPLCLKEDHSSWALSTEEDELEEDELDEDEDDDAYVMIYKSVNSGAMEEEFFNDCSGQCPVSTDHIATSIPMPTSHFLTITSYLPVPLLSLKMKKQMLGQDKHLDMKIQHQMIREVTSKLTRAGSVRANSVDSSRHSSVNKLRSPLMMKRKTNSAIYPGPLATIPHSVSVESQDSVQSYAQCIDEKTFTTGVYLDVPTEEHRGNVRKTVLNRPGNVGTKIDIIAYDSKLISLFREATSMAVDMGKLWRWSKVVNEDEQKRLLGGLVKAGLA